MTENDEPHPLELDQILTTTNVTMLNLTKIEFDQNLKIY